MRELVVSLDSVAALAGESRGRGVFDLGTVATLAELAGADAVRVGLREDLRPVDQSDVQHLRRVARGLELRIPPSQGLLKAVLEGRPDRVVISGESYDGSAGAAPLDLRTQATATQGVLRSLGEAGIPVVLLLPAEVEAVKAAHALGAQGVDLYTGSVLDLPRRERAGALEVLSDAARLAKKLRLEVGLAGSVDASGLPELLEIAPSVQRVAVGRSLLGRSLLLGIDRAVRDLRAALG